MDRPQRREHPIVRFREKLESLEDYPPGVVPVWRYIKGTAFFSAGAGLDIVDDGQLPPFPFGGVMFVGHNLDSVAQYRKRLESGVPHGDLRKPMTTWRNLRRLLADAQIPTSECFFTNAFVGLNEHSTTGPFPGSEDLRFRRWCAEFLTEQVEVMKPRLLVALGIPAQRFVSTILTPKPVEWADPRLASSACISGSIGGQPVDCLPIAHPSSHHTGHGQRRKVLDLAALRRAAKSKSDS